MKLKYYMRGLGIGIILTTLILTIGNPKEKLTDQEIIRRAKVLGMEMKEESNIDLEKILESVKPSQTPTGEPSVTPEGEPTPEPTPVVTEEPIPSPTIQPSVDTVKEGEVSFTIESGLYSDQISDLLQEIGLVEDSNNFNQYIKELGKAGVIRTGFYTIKKGASYDEIIGVITK